MNIATEEEISNKMIKQGWGLWSQTGNYACAVSEREAVKQQGMKAKIVKVPQIEGHIYEVWAKQ